MLFFSLVMYIGHKLMQKGSSHDIFIREFYTYFPITGSVRSAFYIAYFFDNAFDILLIIVDAGRHKVYIQGWTGFKAVVSVEQRTAF